MNVDISGMNIQNNFKVSTMQKSLRLGIHLESTCIHVNRGGWGLCLAKHQVS